MKRRMLFFALASIAFAPVAVAQHSTTSKMSGSHQSMTMQHSMHMGMSGMEALKGLTGKEFNIAFLSQMIAHHQGAIEMAQQALKVTRHAETKKEARMVITDQKKEIAQMTAWLQKWYRVRPSQEHTGMMKADMKAMMSMKITTDKMFFEMMIPHHQGAIEMSQLALKQSDKAEVKQLSKNIIKAQKAEIARYQRMVNRMNKGH